MVFEILHQNTFKPGMLYTKLCCRHRIPMVQNRVSLMLRSAYPVQELILAKMELLNYEISLILLGQIKQLIWSS